jgi:proline dehydrogenase
MLRAILLYLSKAPWARRIVTRWQFARRAAARFVAGDTL